MAEYLDPMGMQTGYDDSNVPKPSQDEMRLALSKKKTSPLDAVATSFKDIAARFNPLTARKSFQAALMPYTEPVATALSAIPAAVAGGAYGIAKGLASPEYGTPAVTNVMNQAASPIIQAMTYQPRTEEGAANLDMILNNEFMRKMPPLLGPYTEGAGVAGLRFRPSDLRAIIGKGELTASELANLPQDFRNAQSGIQKQNILGEPTLGVKAQGVADTIGDYIARREMQGKAPIPGIPAEFQPQTKAYAIRNVGEGAVLKGKKFPNIQTSAVAPFTGFNQVIESARPVATDHPSDIAHDFITRYVGPNDDIDNAWKQFRIDKLMGMYPDAPSPSAAMSAINSVTDHIQRQEIEFTWLKEFADQNPDVPSFDEYMTRVKAADSVLEGPISKHIQKYFGTKEDPLLKAAAEGLTLRPAKAIFNDNQVFYVPTSVQAARTAGGFKAEGEFDAPYAAQITKVKDLDAQLNALNQNRADVEQQIRRDFPDVNAETDPATYTPEYIALRNKYNATTNPNNLKAQELKKAKQDLENLRLARAYELASDTSLVPMDAAHFKRYFNQPGNYGEAQFFPGHQKIRPDEKLFEVMAGKMDVTGYPELASLIVGDIMSGKMPLDQVKNLNIDKYVRTYAKARLAEEADARAKEAKKAEALQTYAKERIANVPDNLRFANSSVLELTSASGTVDEIRKDMALDTYCLDHCMGSGGGGGGERHFLTGDERIHTPVVDPLTGQTPALSSGRDRQYAEAVARGEKIIPSFRDNETGFPVATLELTKRGPTKYTLGYKSGYQNRTINLKYAEDIKNYLNQKAGAIVDTGGTLSENTHVYDTMHHNDIGKAARAAGITEAERTRMDLSSLPRFITAHDFQILKNQQVAGNASMQTDLENLRREREVLASYVPDALTPNALNTQLEDVDSRIRDIEQRMARQPAQQAVQPYREPTEMQQAIQPYRNAPTHHLRDAMGDQQATEVDETAGVIFGNYNHGSVADVIHGLRNGDATAADGLYRNFSIGQRELLARELDRRLLTGEDAEPAQQPATQQAVQPYREHTELVQRAMQVLRNDSTQRLRDAMGEPQAFEVYNAANEIFGNYPSYVAEVVHGLRNGDTTVAQDVYGFFSTRQRELLARELERRLPAPANEDRQVAQQPLGPTQRTFAVNAIANELIETERTGQDYSVPGLQSTMYALANGEHDHPELRALPPEQREQITRQVSIRFRELANNLVRERAMQPIPLVRGMTNSRLVRRAYGDIIQEEQGDLESMRGHLAITIQALNDPDLNADIIEELRANRHPERLTQLREMLEAHIDAVLTATNMNEEPAPGLGDNAPGLGANPAYQIETAQTSLPRPVIDFLETFFRDNNIDSHPENILEDNYRDLLEQITRGESEVEGLTPRQRDEALTHVDTVMQNMGLNVDFDDVDYGRGLRQPGANRTSQITDMLIDFSIDNPIETADAYRNAAALLRNPRSARELLADIMSVGDSLGDFVLRRNDLSSPTLQLVADELEQRANNMQQAQLPAPAQQAQLPPPAEPPEAGQQLNRAIVNAYTEPLQFASTPGSSRLMQATIDHVNTMANNMFGAGYSTDEIARNLLQRLNARRSEVIGLTPEVLGVDRTSYNSFLGMLTYAIDDLSAVYGRIDPAQQAQLPAPAQQAQLPAPAQQQVANANVLPRNIQTASLTQLNGELSTLQQNEARELAAEAAHPNNANTPTDLRVIAQRARQYSQGQIWEDFNPAQRELLARALEQHAIDIEMQQRPPGHKKGGYITRKPSIDDMRFALMKGK